jgi:hypothetical protein
MCCVEGKLVLKQLDIGWSLLKKLGRDWFNDNEGNCGFG